MPLLRERSDQSAARFLEERARKERVQREQRSRLLAGARSNLGRKRTAVVPASVAIVALRTRIIAMLASAVSMRVRDLVVALDDGDSSRTARHDAIRSLEVDGLVMRRGGERTFTIQLTPQGRERALRSKR